MHEQKTTDSFTNDVLRAWGVMVEVVVVDEFNGDLLSILLQQPIQFYTTASISIRVVNHAGITDSPAKAAKGPQKGPMRKRRCAKGARLAFLR
jgi:hypothetical protein